MGEAGIEGIRAGQGKADLSGQQVTLRLAGDLLKLYSGCFSGDIRPQVAEPVPARQKRERRHPASAEKARGRSGREGLSHLFGKRVVLTPCLQDGVGLFQDLLEIIRIEPGMVSLHVAVNALFLSLPLDVAVNAPDVDMDGAERYDFPLRDDRHLQAPAVIALFDPDVPDEPPVCQTVYPALQVILQVRRQIGCREPRLRDGSGRLLRDLPCLRFASVVSSVSSLCLCHLFLPV